MRWFCLVLLLGLPAFAGAEKMSGVRVSTNGRGFVLEDSGRAWIPWGFNYDHDEQGRLLEDYWDREWPKVEADFGEMKQLGANVVIGVDLARVQFQIDAVQHLDRAEAFGDLVQCENDGHFPTLTQAPSLAALSCAAKMKAMPDSPA